MVDARYGRQGFDVERAVLAPDLIAHAREEADRLFSDDQLTRPGNGRTRVRASLSGDTVVDRLDPVCDVSPLFAALARAPVLMDLAAVLLGAPALLFKDKIITKPPGTAGYGLHQDYMRWQSFPPSAEEMTTLAICLDPATERSGAVEVFIGQHDRLLTPPGVVADPEPDDVDASATHIVELSPGDVLAIHPLVPHRSDYNRSGNARRMLFFTFSTARHGDLRPTYYARHGEIFDDALAPELAPTVTSLGTTSHTG